MIAKAVFIIGSLKKKVSTSAMLAGCLADALTELGVGVASFDLRKQINTPGSTDALARAARDADLLVFSFPVNFDTIPYCVSQAFESLQADLLKVSLDKKPAVSAIVNCGYPESRHTHLALEVCRHFAQALECRWLGGIGFGGGEWFDGRPLKRFLPFTAGILSGLKLSATALSQGRAIPKKAIKRISGRWTPSGLYRAAAAYRWYRLARRNHVLKTLLARPYASRGDDRSDG